MQTVTPEEVKWQINERSKRPWRLFPILLIFVLLAVAGYAVWYGVNNIQKFTTAAPKPQHTFTTKLAHDFTGTVLGHDKGLVAVLLPQDPAPHYYPMEDLTLEDQNYVNTLDSSYGIDWPLDCMIQDGKGGTTRALIKGRLHDFAIVADAANNTVDYRPISSFAPDDQRVLLRLGQSTSPHYPINCLITDAAGRALPVVVSGRTDLAVNFRLANGTATTYPLSKLSAASRDFLLSLPGDIDTLEIKRLRDRNDKLAVDNLRLQAKIASPNSSPGEHDLAMIDLSHNEQEIQANKLLIEADTKSVELSRAQKSGP
ncbi:MAG TPA: hypothetical protein VHC95_11795 [Opitutales bacterium]|nr:hypothetical protein [Opitutales bacterium]